MTTLCVLSLALVARAKGDGEWSPTGEWPFLNRQFKVATVYTGVFNRHKTVVPCNIHVGRHALWYVKNDTLMEALPGTVAQVEFADGDRYMPVGRDQAFGRIVREDTISGSVARLILVQSVDQQELDQRYLNHINKSQNALQGALLSAVADTEGGVKLERQPLPLTSTFHIQVRGEIFPATRKQILAHINPARRKEYKLFTRTAEIISSSETSMLKVWREFFLKW